MTTVMRFTSLMAVVLLLGACSKKGTNMSAADGERVPITGIERSIVDGETIETVESAPMDTSGPQSGTQQDLVVNVGDRVFFGYDQSDLQTEARETVERQAQWLRAYPGVQITVQGHADERGTREYNLALGEKRAMAVRNYLVALGIEANRVDTISYGKERPAVMGSNNEAWAQNRRAVVVVR